MKPDMFGTKLLTADPQEHLRRAGILLDKNDDALLQYAALELRLCIERILHNQLTLCVLHSKKNKKGIDPKKKKLIMGNLDPASDFDYDIYYTNPEDGSRTFWGTYKNIPEEKVKGIEGRLGNYLHMKRELKLGISDDPWYRETRNFLTETQKYLAERTRNSEYYFSYSDVDNFELIKKQHHGT